MSKLNLKISHPDLNEVKSELLGAINFYKPLSILLIGSYSRGDYWRGDVYTSDVEFYIIVDKNIQSKSKPYFKYCDVSIIRKNRLKYLPKNLINFEAKELGVTVYGEDLRYLIPTVTIDNIDQGIVDEIILFRFLEISNAIIDDKDVDFVVTKNLNYLMAWSLIKDGVLLPGFIGRNEFFILDKNDNITSYLFHDSENICGRIIETRLGNCMMPKGGDNMLEIFERLMTNYSDLLFAKRKFRSKLTQVFYLSKSSDLSFIYKLKFIVESIFVSDYRKILVSGLYVGIMENNKKMISDYISKCISYYPFLNEK